MNEEDIDYEHLDDLPLLEHIEWNHEETEEVSEVAADGLDAIDWLSV